jgi:hypothetical protein
MELRCYIYEQGAPMSVDTDLYPYEVISVIDELENILNSKGVWIEKEQRFAGNKTDIYYSVSPKKHMDYLVIVCEDKKTREPKPFPADFLDKWVKHGVPFYIHPANYGMPPIRRVWNQVSVRLTIADDRTLDRKETGAEEACLI